MRKSETRPQSGGIAPILAAGLAALLAVTLVGFLLVDDDGTDDLPAERGIPAATYRDVVLGVDREALTERLLPARPVDAAVLDRAPDPGDGECLHYRVADRDQELYRFCFEDDRLVAKSVLSPDAD